MKIGQYEVTTIETGRFALDGGAMFGVVPKTLWSKSNPADEENRIDLALRVLLVRGGGKTILVDTGIGDKWTPKLASIYKIDHTRWTLPGSLAALGISPEDVTDVIHTHLHFDHCGGSTTRLASGELVPTFPNATYHVQHQNFVWAMKPSEKDRASYLKENFEPLKSLGVLHEVEGAFELLPGIEVMVSNGHTPGQQLIRIVGEKESIVYCADLVPTASHIPLPYVMGYDLYPLTTMEEKKKMLARAYEEHWTLAFEHDPFHSAATIVATERGFGVGEKLLLGG